MAIRVGIIGCGYWGRQVARNLAEDGRFEIVAVAEPDHEALTQAKTRYCVDSYDCFGDGLNMIASHASSSAWNLDAVAITTPVETHYELGIAALQADLHVLMAKPLAATSEQSTLLRTEAVARQCVLMTDHTFTYAPPVTELAAMISDHLLGDIWHISSERTNLGLVRSDVDVIWDLAVHDLSILLTIMPKHQPVAVSAIGTDPLGIGRVSVAHVTVDLAPVKTLEPNVLVSIQVSWLAPVKTRRFVVTGSAATAIWDDLDASEPLKVFDRGVDLDPDTARVSYRLGSVMGPRMDRTEALLIEVGHFADRINRNAEPHREISHVVVKMLEAASVSLADGGVRVPV